VGTGRRTERSPRREYFDAIAARVTLGRRLKVVVDAGNGIAGSFAPELLRRLGAEVIELYCESDGTFPNHLPDP
jgi:phosphomannomutase/phosphoglucomutase